MPNTLELLAVTQDPSNGKNGGFVVLADIYKKTDATEDPKPTIQRLIETHQLMVKQGKDGPILNLQDSLAAFLMDQDGSLHLKLVDIDELARMEAKIGEGGWDGKDMLKSLRPEGVNSNAWSKAYADFMVSRGRLLFFTKDEYNFLPKNGYYIGHASDHARHVTLIGEMMKKPVKGYASLAKRVPGMSNIYVRLWMERSKDIIEALPVVK